LNCHPSTAKGRFSAKLWLHKVRVRVKNLFSLNLDLVKNLPSTANKQQLKSPPIQDQPNWALNNRALALT